MTVRKLKQLIKIAKQYKMYPLVHYYELKIELIELQKKYERGRSNSYQKRAGYGSSIHY